MAINGEESSLLDYTAQWIREVNRGGLFEVNDTAYLLFREIQLSMYYKLVRLLHSSIIVDRQKEDLITAVCTNNDVQFYWSMLSVDIIDEADSLALLKTLGLLYVDILLLVVGWRCISITNLKQLLKQDHFVNL